MIDCREFGIRELCLNVYNTEFLYNQRFTLTQTDLIFLGVRFTTEQWIELQNDLRDEMTEEFERFL